MYLKSLTLKGFKSFAQPTTFAFEPGVTCIVGPNGSGKSNVVDALAWVMGEQGAKTLRGGKMEDVIFAGTATRGPLGRAEVSLTIDNADGALPIEYSEVTISRTLFRNGTSEYAINGETCRLLDVQELLSDSGLGREMHVIVGQGQLDAVLHASAEDRRGFIEEAAGILKHRRRKEKTLRKLDAMQANLTRLSDLAGEIRRQLKPLGRQAEVAREAATIAAVVRDARARLLADEVVGLRRALDAHGRSEQERHSERQVLQQELEQHQAKVERLEATYLGDDVDAARSTSHALESAQDRLRSLDALARQRIALLSAQVEPTDAAPSVTRAMIDEATAGLDVFATAVGDAASALDGATAATRAARDELDVVDEGIARQSARVTAYDLELSGLAGQADTAASKLAAVRGEVLRHANALDAAASPARGRGRRTRARRRPRPRPARAPRPISTRRTSSPRRPSSRPRPRSSASARRCTRVSASRAPSPHERPRCRSHSTRRTARRRSSARTSPACADCSPRRCTSSRASSPPSPRHSARSPMRCSSTTAPRHSARSSTPSAASSAASRSRSPNPVPPRESTPVVDGLTPASAVVTAPEGVVALLAEVLIADDLAAARAAEPALARLEAPATVITKDGTVVGRYVIRGGTGREQSRIELIAERDRAGARLEELRAELDRSRFDLAEQRTILERSKEQAKQALAALREFDAQLARRTEQLNRARVQAEAAQAEAARLEQAAANAEERVADAERASDEAKLALEQARAVARPVLDTTARDGALAALERAREAEVEARLRLETAKERVRAEEARVRAMERQFEAEQQAAADAARRAVVRRAQLAAAARVADSLPAALASVDASVAEARVALGRAEANRASRNEELLQVRRQETAVRERLHAVTEDVHGLELRIYEKKLHVAGLVERAESELGLAESVLVAEYGPDVEIPGEDEEAPSRPFVREEQQRRLTGAERKLAQLGRVNPLALEEFAALEQRHQFLTEQLTDLANTRRDLLTIIEEIDGKMESIFRGAFEDTRDAFAEVFPVLFPGGVGSISLTDPDNMLTTGIEVSVKPAGKKIERLSLLSGGERSLAAVALLIAIFKARPSPFYIMDEVEAALDDANLGRLLTTLEDLRESSQLIVITHQKRTMEIADALYGVSMRQDGVSAVVGQRVREEREARAS